MADTVDASIPLVGANIASAGEQSMISAFDFATKVREYQRQQQAQNMLMQIFANPNSIDPKTGMPNAAAVQGIMRVDPEMGMKLSDEMIALNVDKMKERAAQSGQGKLAFDYSTKVAGIVTGVYDDTLASTGDPNKAAEAARNERNDMFRNSGGILSDDEVDRGIAAPFDINVARRLQEANPDYVKKEKTQEEIDIIRIGAGLPPLYTKIVPTPTTPAAPGKPITLADAITRFTAPESGGAATAVSPTSSATGADQFIDSTWLKEMKANRPDLMKGKTDAQILAMRDDPKLSAEMAADYAKENADDLKAKGLPVTSGTVYLAHHFGAGGAEAILNADPNASAATILGPEVVKANPYIAKMTAGQLLQNVKSKVGDNPIEGYESTSTAAAPAAAPSLPDPNSPEGKAMMHGKGWKYVTDSDGTVYRANVDRGLFTNKDATNWYKPKSMANVGSTTAASTTDDVPMPTPGSPADRDLSYVAEQYRLKGVLPNLGMGQAGITYRKQIIKKAAQLAAAQGSSGAGDVAMASDVKATQTGLNQLARTAANVKSFEGTAVREADLVMSLLDKGSAKSGIPVLNAWIQAGRKGVTGDPDVSAFDAAITSFKNEYARIMSSPGGTGGVTSDAARHEADALINDAQTPDMIRHNIEVMKKGMDNRIKSIDAEHDALVQKLRAMGQPQGGTTPPSKFVAGRVYTDANGNKAKYNSDGTWTPVQ